MDVKIDQTGDEHRVGAEIDVVGRLGTQFGCRRAVCRCDGGDLTARNGNDDSTGLERRRVWRLKSVRLDAEVGHDSVSARSLAR